MASQERKLGIAERWMPVLEKFRSITPKYHKVVSQLMENQYEELKQKEGSITDFTRFALPMLVAVFNGLLVAEIDIIAVTQSSPTKLIFVGPPHIDLESLTKTGMESETTLTQLFSHAIVEDIVKLKLNPFKLKTLFKDPMNASNVEGPIKSFVMEYQE